MLKRVLITGGSGLLALNWALAMRNCCEITLGLHSRKISLAGTKAKKINLESVDRLSRQLQEIDCQVVIHAAGLANVEQCESAPACAQYINVTLASNVAHACSKLGIQLVHISTDHLFSGRERLLTEEWPISPINVYGKTKAEAEFRVQEIYPKALVIRTNFYGWGASYRHSFSDTILKNLQLGREIMLFQDVFFTPILIENLAKAVHQLIDLKVSGIFNVVGNDRLSKYEFGCSIAKKFELDSSKIFPSLLADQIKLTQRPSDMSLSNRKLEKYLGRSVGGVQDHLTALYQQHETNIFQELQKL